MCRKEARDLSSAKEQLDELGVPLYAVVHERKGADVFQSDYFSNGTVYLDKERTFYGVQKRWMQFSGFIRPSLWRWYYQATKSVEGNFEGEGRILGGLFVMDSGDGAILLEHKEKQFGDVAKLENIIAAAQKISTVKKRT